MRASKIVRISESTKAKLDKLFREKGDSYGKIIDRLATDAITRQGNTDKP